MERVFFECYICDGKGGHFEQYYCEYTQETKERFTYCHACDGKNGYWEWVE